MVITIAGGGSTFTAGCKHGSFLAAVRNFPGKCYCAL